MTSNLYPEKDVEETIRNFLKKNNFDVKDRETITGVDIFAEKDGRVFLIECKGNLRKDGKETEGSQYDIHLGEAFFQIAKRMEEFRDNAEYFIAFPNSEKILRRIRDRDYFRKLNKINYLFIDEDKELSILKFGAEEIIKIRDF